jgi:hypothetical protein
MGGRVWGRKETNNYLKVPKLKRRVLIYCLQASDS